MGNFRRPGQPIKLRPSKINDFKGIGGASDTVLKRTNERGWDVSNLFFNDIRDFDLPVAGTADVRWGNRKIDNTGKGATITAIFPVNLGGKRRYGIIYGGQLDVIDVPDYVGKMLDPLELTPPTVRATVTTEYPIHDPSEFQI